MKIINKEDVLKMIESNKNYECWTKHNNRYIFIGWYPITWDFNDKIYIKEYNRKRHLYVNHIWKNNNTSTYKYVLD